MKLQKAFNLPETEDSDTLREYTNLKCAENKIPTAEIEKSKSVDDRTPMQYTVMGSLQSPNKIDLSSVNMRVDTLNLAKIPIKFKIENKKSNKIKHPLLKNRYASQKFLA